MSRKKIRFVTDSVCDIPFDLIDKWNIGVVPAFVNYGGNSYADDGVELDRKKYFDEILDMDETPTTAAPPPTLAQKIIQPIFEESDHVFIITTPKKLSGIYNSMRLAIQDLPEDRVTLIDSGQLSMALGFQVLIGAEVAEETGDVEKTRQAIESVRRHQTLYAVIATMELLKRSGRVGWATANIGALLQIKPVIEVQDGEVMSVARVRTFNRALSKLLELPENYKPFDRVALLHINNLEAIETLKKSLADLLPDDTIVTDAGPTLGTHIGPGAVGIAVVSESWKA